jgi:hypothetical protein
MKLRFLTVTYSCPEFILITHRLLYWAALYPSMNSGVGKYDGTALLEDASNLIVGSKPSFSGGKSVNAAIICTNAAGSYTRKNMNIPCLAGRFAFHLLRGCLLRSSSLTHQTYHASRRSSSQVPVRDQRRIFGPPAPARFVASSP